MINKSLHVVTLFITTCCLSLSVMATISCHHARHEEPSRTVSDVFNEAITAMMDTSGAFSLKEVSCLYDEIADSLFNPLTKPDIGDYDSRIAAYDMAGLAIESIFYSGNTEAGPNELEKQAMKLSEALWTWRAESSDDGTVFIKEVPYYIRKDTDNSERKVMFVSAKVMKGEPSIVLLPEKSTFVSCIFANHLPQSALYDMEDGHTTTLEPIDLEESHNLCTCYFESDSFIARLKSYDAMFVFYATEDERNESVLVPLERLHSLLAKYDGSLAIK